MNGILEQEEFSELLHEHGETAEVQALVEEFFATEMMSREIGSTEFKAYLERLDLQLVTLGKDDTVISGAVKIQ
ncbi:hypothetical protein [Shewanella chilikensis]|uniref:hypothetical protein n=1 Tax=Shewanella chilikensis TaxID=558541 RepID=UPI00399C2CCA